MSEEKNLKLKKEFIDLLQKLNINETRDGSFNQIKNLIKENASDKSLRIYLNSLMTFNSNSITAKEKITYLFGFIGNIYKSNLLDPLDNPKSLIKTINRIICYIRNNILKNNFYKIHKVASNSIIEILNKCMDKNDKENLNKIFIEPFILAIINNPNIYIKNGCCVYLNDLILNIKEKTDFSLSIFDIIINQNNYVNDLILKINVNLFENEYLYESLYNLINFFPFKYFKNKLSSIIKKIIQILNQKNNLTVGTLINCFKILNILGKKSIKKKIKINPKPIIQSLIPYLNNKNKDVKHIIRETLNLWDEMEKSDFFDKEEKNNEEKKIFVQNMVDRTKKGKIEQFAQYDSEIVEKMRKDVYNNGIGNLIYLSKFIQEHTRIRNENYNYENNFRSNLPKLTEKRLKQFNYNNAMSFENPKTNVFHNLNNIIYNKTNNNKGNNYNNRHNGFNNMDYINNNINNNDYLNKRGNNDINLNIKEVEKQIGDNLFPLKYEEEINENKNLNLSNTEIDENENIIETITENNNTFKKINISEIMNKFNDIKKNLSDYERKINSKGYKVENKIIRVKNLIGKNIFKIQVKHGNILNETQMEKELELFPISLKFLNNNDYENAFANILGDDIYLIRLLLLSRAHLEDLKVSNELFKKIIFRLNGINKSYFIENIIFSIIQILNPNIIINEPNNILVNDIINTMNEIKQYKNEKIKNTVAYILTLIYNLYNNYKQY